MRESLYYTSASDRFIAKIGRMENTAFVFVRCIRRLQVIHRQRAFFKGGIGYKFECVLIQFFSFIFVQNGSYYAVVNNKSVSIL